MRCALLAGVLIAACGARPSPAVVVPQGGPIETTVAGVRVVRAHRATAGHAATALFVRTREGSAALRATAALVLEARGAGAWRVRATPDGLAIRASADTDTLETTLASLARALEVRDATGAEVGHALDHVRRRRAARRTDDTATATRLAIEALGGVSVDAFGSADDDTSIDSAAVSAWLAGVLGQERTLVGVVGDVEGEALRASIARAFADAPHVPAAREEASSWHPGSARTAHGATAVAAVATSAGSLDEAARLADWINRLVPSAHASSFPLRGRAIVTATMPGDPTALGVLTHAVARARTLDDERRTPWARDAESDLLAIGDAWLARVGTDATADVGLGLVRVSEDDGLDAEDPSLDALAGVESPTPTQLDDARGEAILENGMHARVARSDGDAVAVSIAWASGAALDPPREHGRTALLAAVVARSCEPDADASWVDDASFGVVVRGERATLERTALRAIDCARNASIEVAHTEGARASAIADLALPDRVRVWAATVLAPGAPGLVAPEGSASGLAAATELDDALDTALDPRGATLSIVADESPERLLAIAAALGSAFAPRTDARAPVRAIPEGPTESFLTDGELDAPLAIVALRTDVGRSELGARTAARLLAEQLAARDLPVRAWLGQAAARSSFAVVAVTGTEERLDALRTTARDAIAAVALPSELARDDAEGARSDALTLAAPAALARSLGAPHTSAAATDVAQALLAAPVHLVLVRPTSAALRRAR